MCSHATLKGWASVIAGITAIAVPAVLYACSTPIVRVTKSAAASINPGGVLVYTITVANDPSTGSVYRDFLLIDPIPAGLTFLPAQSNPLCFQNGANINCRNVDRGPCGRLAGPCGSILLVGETVTFQIAFQVPANACGQTYRNQASITSTTLPGVFPPYSSNVVTTTTAACVPPPGCVNVKKEALNPNGQLISPVPAFSFRLDNNAQVTTDANGNATFGGNVPAGSHVVTENPQAGWNLVSVTPAGGNVTVVSNACTLVTFRNQQVPPDLTIYKIGPSAVMRGNTFSYTIGVANSGPWPAHNVLVVDPIPVGMTFNAGASDAICSVQGANIVCNLGTLNPGGRSLTLSFIAPHINPCFTTNIQNQAFVTTSTTESNANNNASPIVPTRIDCQPQSSSMSSSRSSSVASSIPSSIASSVPSSVMSSSRASSIPSSIASSIPSSVASSIPSSVASSIPSSVASSVMSSSAASSIPSSIASSIPSSVASSIPSSVASSIPSSVASSIASSMTSSSIPSSVTSSSVASSFVSSIPLSSVASSIQSSSVASSMSSAGFGCIRVLKEAFGPTGTLLIPVPQFTFMMENGRSATNDSSGIATFSNVAAGMHTITESVPSGWSVINVTPANGSVSVPPGSACATVSFKNQQFYIPPPPPQRPSFEVRKTDNRSIARRGDVLTYEITVMNVSNYGGTSTVIDWLPSTLEFLSASHGGVLRDRRVIWDDVYLGPRESRRFTIDARVAACTTIVNRAEATEGGSATDSTAVEDCGAIPICRDSDIALSKFSDRYEAQPGDLVTFTITARNVGSQPVDGVTIEDKCEGGATVVVDAGGAQINGTNLRWDVGRLGPGETRTFTYRTRLDSNLHHGDTVTNSATVQSRCGSSQTVSTIRIIEQLPQTGFLDGKNPYLTRIKNVGEPADTGSALSWILSLLGGMAAAVGTFARRWTP